eukprot:CAMPEP_0117623376 /NCGR_PEP_ID=MMETSP0784-20121206/88615_1 /TAXON_ID=39447 /ORGANISM="" /LENGTH=453 /DNA_ID=CAMNT_0005427325 /DNA_START=71 /DNA_END=1428 /DNA_ORIENTATION=+
MCLVRDVRSQTCKAGDATCSGDVVSRQLQCVSWRQTGSCSPHGRRERAGDKPCSQLVETGSSGFCECAGGLKVRMSDCDHRPFQCSTACLEYERYTCISWRQSSGCSADGASEPQNDKSCDQKIDPGASGFCECGGGRKVKRPGCEMGHDFEPFTCAEQCSREADLYEELDLDSSATERDIKGAFRKMSLKYHPDKTRNDPALTARFNAIRESYEVLSNSEHRAVYDSGGYKMLTEAQGNKMKKGPAREGSIEVGLDALYNGMDLQRNVNRRVICRNCRDVNTPRCQKCNAGCANEFQTVNVQMGPFMMQQQQEVPSKERCRQQAVKLDVQVEPGMAAGDTIVFKGMGEHKPKMIPGDVIMKIKQRPHPVFERAGNNLNMEVKLTLKEAILGWERTIEHLDGRKIVLTNSAVTKPMEVLRVHEEGMPSRGDPTARGDLFVKCIIKMPSYDKIS